MEKILKKLNEKIDDLVIVKQRDDLYFINIKKEHTDFVLRYLKLEESFKHLAFMQAVDYIENNQFQITYMLFNYDNKINLGINIMIDREKAEMDSMHKVWPTIWQYQREIHEMYGIDFPDSPRVNESFVLEGWEEMPPMRRDFDTLEYSNRTFYPRPGRSTNDPKEYMKEKMYNDFAKSPKIRRDNE